MSARIKDTYVKEIVPRLIKEREYPNVMAVPRLKKVVVTPRCVTLAWSKLPSTVSGVAGCIARAWSDARYASASCGWHVAHLAPPTKVGGDAALAGLLRDGWSAG